MSEHPTEPPPPSSAARPATTGVEDPHARTYAAPVTPAAPDEDGLRWAPLLSRTQFLVVSAVGVIVGIAGPILLWLNFSYANKGTKFPERLGYLLVLVGLGLVIIAVPLLLGETARLVRTSSLGAGSTRPDPVRGLTGTRMLALVAVLVVLAGVFLMRPAEAAATSGGGGSSQGGGGGGGGGGGKGG